MKRKKTKRGKHRWYVGYKNNSSVITLYADDYTDAVERARQISPRMRPETVRRLDDGETVDGRKIVRKNPMKRKSVKRKKAKHKAVKRTPRRKATPGRKPRVTVVRKNPRRVSFKETKSKSFSSYMLRGKFMGIESPYYLGEDDRFHRGVTGVKKFKSETIARDYVLRMRGILGRRFPTLNTVQVTRAK